MDSRTIYELRAAKNGHILTVTASDDGVEEVVHQSDHEDEVDSFHAFICEVVDTYGPQRDSYGPRNISVQIKAGRKYECEFTYAGVKIIADCQTDAAGEYAGALYDEVCFYKRWKIPLEYISIHNGVVKGHERA